MPNANDVENEPQITYQPTDMNPVERTLTITPETPENENAGDDGSEAENENENISLINEGSYGCVFYPGIRCNGKLEDRKYITKIQKRTHVTQNEYDISRRIRKKIRNYRDYFAPITKQCPVKLTQRYLDDVKKCNVFRNETPRNESSQTPTEYISNKIRYLGTETIKTRLLNIASGKIYADAAATKPVPMSISFWSMLLTTHIRLLRSVSLLWKAGVVHMDIKCGNVMFDPEHHTPILIDFGISIRQDQLIQTPAAAAAADAHEHAFYVYDTYSAWCLEIFLCCYVVNQIGLKNAADRFPTKPELETILNEFQYGHGEKHPEQQTTRNDIFSTTFVNAQTIRDCKQKAIQTYFPANTNPNTNPNPKSWKQIYEDCLKNTAHTWDLYSLAVMYLGVLDTVKQGNREAFLQIEQLRAPHGASTGTGTGTSTSSTTILHQYVSVLQRSIYTNGADRPTIGNMIHKLREILVSVSRIGK